MAPCAWLQLSVQCLANGDHPNQCSGTVCLLCIVLRMLVLRGRKRLIKWGACVHGASTVAAKVPTAVAQHSTHMGVGRSRRRKVFLLAIRNLRCRIQNSFTCGVVLDLLFCMIRASSVADRDASDWCPARPSPASLSRERAGGVACMRAVPALVRACLRRSGVSASWV